MSAHPIKLKKGYALAKCCWPEPDEPIMGYVSYNRRVIVHKVTCHNLKNVDLNHKVLLSWNQILDKEEEKPDQDFFELEELDFRILKHHQVMGVDYSLMVAKILKVSPQQVFHHHRKLRDLRLLERVEKVMIQYRQGIVDNKWIKHRNHTYYRITPKGEKCLNFYLAQANRKI
ncbi:MAG: DUF2250 domain-containing protein [Candidatus Zixiibacteriota bacterium]